MKKKDLVVYDIECLPNFFCMCFESSWSTDKILIEISSRRDDRLKLKSITNHYTLVGYNSSGYDDLLTQMVLSDVNATNKELYSLSRAIVKRDFDNELLKKYRHKRTFDSIDIMTLLASSKLRVSLKHLQVRINWHKVQDFEVNWDKPLPQDKWDECIDYCFNDVSSLKAVLKLKEKDLDLRDQIQNKYGLDFRSMDGVKIAETMLCSHIAKGLDMDLKTFMFQDNVRVDEVIVKDIINDFVSFKTSSFNKVLDYFKSKTIIYIEDKTKSEKQLSYRMILEGVPLDFGLGGLHAWSDGQILKPAEDEYLIMPDVSSYYPSQIVSLKYPHRHDPYFIEKYQEAYIDKAEGKRTKDAMREWLAKLMLNSSFGKMLSVYSPLYSPETAYRITINGQLMLLMLIEKLHLANFKIVGANTDAIEVIVKKDRYDEYLAICEEWSDLTKMNLDHDKFAVIYRKSCNHYVGIKANDDGSAQIDKSTGRFKVKLKGGFEQETDILKGANPDIIKKALFENLVYGTSVANTVKSCTNIYDFCMASRVGGKFTSTHFNKKLQKTNRYYAGVGPSSAYLYKAEANASPSHILKQSKVIIMNDYVKYDNIEDYNINYSYYINVVYDILDSIKPKQLTLF